MGHLRGLTNLGVELNPTHMGDWPWRIGQFILNFGAIELISYQYLNSLEPTREDFDKNLARLLGPRIDRVLELIAASLTMSYADKAQIEAMWFEAKELSHWRNRIAHNPVLPTWKTSDPERDPPDLIGIPDMRQIKASDESNSISRSLMDRLVDASADLGSRLHGAAAKLRGVA